MSLLFCDSLLLAALFFCARSAYVFCCKFWLNVAFLHDMSRGPQYVFLTLLRLTVSAVRPVLSLFLAALGSLPARWADDPGPEASSYFRLPSLFFCFAGGVQPRGLPAHFSGMQSYCENTGWGLSCAPVLVLLSFSTSCLQVGWIRVPYHESARRCATSAVGIRSLFSMDYYPFLKGLTPFVKGSK